MSQTLYQFVLEKYRNHVFVETGSHKGGGIAIALLAGFEKIYSIEIHESYYSACCAKFKDDKRVNLFLGDSSKVLPRILQELDCQATFWIDAHAPQNYGGAVGIGWNRCPALLELDAIAQHPIKTHTIMIDDFYDFGTAQHDDITPDQIREKLRAINQEYTFRFEGSKMGLANAILVASVEPS